MVALPKALVPTIALIGTGVIINHFNNKLLKVQKHGFGLRFYGITAASVFSFILLLWLINFPKFVASTNPEIQKAKSEVRLQCMTALANRDFIQAEKLMADSSRSKALAQEAYNNSLFGINRFFVTKLAPFLISGLGVFAAIFPFFVFMLFQLVTGKIGDLHFWKLALPQVNLVFCLNVAAFLVFYLYVSPKRAETCLHISGHWYTYTLTSFANFAVLVQLYWNRHQVQGEKVLASYFFWTALYHGIVLKVLNITQVYYHDELEASAGIEQALWYLPFIAACGVASSFYTRYVEPKEDEALAGISDPIVREQMRAVMQRTKNEEIRGIVREATQQNNEMKSDVKSLQEHLIKEIEESSAAELEILEEKYKEKLEKLQKDFSGDDNKEQRQKEEAELKSSYEKRKLRIAEKLQRAIVRVQHELGKVVIDKRTDQLNENEKRLEEEKRKIEEEFKRLQSQIRQLNESSVEKSKLEEELKKRQEDATLIQNLRDQLERTKKELEQKAFQVNTETTATDGIPTAPPLESLVPDAPPFSLVPDAPPIPNFDADDKPKTKPADKKPAAKKPERKAEGPALQLDPNMLLARLASMKKNRPVEAAKPAPKPLTNDLAAQLAKLRKQVKSHEPIEENDDESWAT